MLELYSAQALGAIKVTDRAPMSSQSSDQRPYQYQCRSICQLLYTFKRTKILLQSQGKTVEHIEKVALADASGNFLNHVNVTYRSPSGQSYTANLSSLEYYELFQGDRQKRAEDYHARADADDPLLYIVKSTVDTDEIKPWRQVRLSPHGLSCTCEDYGNMSLYLQQHPYLWWHVLQGGKLIACKHVHATLNTLAFPSVSDYLKTWQPGGCFVQYK